MFSEDGRCRWAPPVAGKDGSSGDRTLAGAVATLAAITAHTGQEHRDHTRKVWFCVWAKEPGTEKTVSAYCLWSLGNFPSPLGPGTKSLCFPGYLHRLRNKPG